MRLHALYCLSKWLEDSGDMCRAQLDTYESLAFQVVDAMVYQNL